MPQQLFGSSGIGDSERHAGAVQLDPVTGQHWMGVAAMSLLAICLVTGALLLVVRLHHPAAETRWAPMWLYALSAAWCGFALYRVLGDSLARNRTTQGAWDSWGLVLLLWALVLVALFGAKASGVVRDTPHDGALLWSLVAAMLFPSLCALAAPASLMLARPTKDWMREAKQADTAVVFAFGSGPTEHGRIDPGAANRFLWDWTLANTTATEAFVGDAVFGVACGNSGPALASCSVSGREVRRIAVEHPRTGDSTLETALAAVDRIAKLGRRRVVLVAHQMQLERAAVDTLAASKALKIVPGQESQFVIPEMPPTPFLVNGVNDYSRNPYVYRIAELLLFRPRDAYFCAVTALIPTKTNDASGPQ